MHQSYIPVKAKLKKWFSPNTFVAEKFRGSLLGAVISITIAEICTYKLLQRNVKAGLLPPQITDLLILLLALVETIVSPIVGWFGRNQRRMLLIVACLVGAANGLLWFALPDVQVSETVGYCNGNNTLPGSNAFGGTTDTAVRLSIILFTFIVFGVIRITIWCHGIAYLDEQAPSRLAMHYGVLSTHRLLFLAMGYNIMSDMVETNKTLQICLTSISLMLNSLLIYLNIPKVAPEQYNLDIAPMNNLSLSSSVSRVFFNTLATSQMVSMGLIAAALWGFAYHQTDFLRVKYYLHLDRNTYMNNAELLRNHAVILAIAYVGLKCTPPIMSNVVNTSVLTYPTRMYVLSIILYVLMAVIGCETGVVAGLGEKSYLQPQCSQVCGCAPQWQEFAPVCVVEDMTTYLSPCHAGCSGVEEVGGLQVYSNCTCVSNRRAIGGSCSSNSCSGAFQMHQILFALLLSTSAISFQTHGTVMMRAVGVQDKSVVLGMAGATVALFTFVFGHLTFVGISWAGCIWTTGGRCHMHVTRYPLWLSGACVLMLLISTVLTVTTLVCIKLTQRRKNSDKSIANVNQQRSTCTSL